MTNPQRNPNEPSREQVDKVAFEVCIMTPNEMAKWHLAELHRETSTIKQALAVVTGDLQHCQGEHEKIQQQLEQAEAKFNRLADDALVALAGHVATPEETYKQAPHCLSGDIRRLINDFQTRILEMEAKCGEKDEALRNLRNECITADFSQAEGDGSYTVDGSFLDAAAKALTTTGNTLLERVKGLDKAAKLYLGLLPFDHPCKKSKGQLHQEKVGCSVCETIKALTEAKG